MGPSKKSLTIKTHYFSFRIAKLQPFFRLTKHFINFF